MNFQEFRSDFNYYPLISIKEIEKLHPSFDDKNLGYWQKKGYIQKVRNGWYRLAENPMNSDVLYFISNHIYQPSYISLETALSYYGFIPEGVFKTTAVSTLKTQEFTTPAGIFSYRNVKPGLFFGYRLISFGAYHFKLAEPEKTILDYLYFHTELVAEDHFFELRLDAMEIRSVIDFDTFQRYLALINSKALAMRAKIFIKFVEQASS